MDTPAPQLVIARKRDGHALTEGEIAAFVRGATDGSWADYQLSAMLMAICVRGMSAQETAWLTAAMLHSGARADLTAVPGVKVDKHSTGGVGDKVSLPLAPLVAACGVAVPMMSGRGLGHTGGTLDKLESIPGFRTGLSLDEFRTQLQHLGVAMIGQTDELAPADRKLYALRDVTGTVESLPLICASIMSKKLAEGADALVLDVKFGNGAFMTRLDDARALAQAMVDVGRAMGQPVRALLTSMEQPLGRTIGHTLEVLESVELLQGRGPADLREVTLALGAHMLVLGRVADDLATAHARLERAIADGSALAKLRALVVAQGGDPAVIDDPARLPQAPHQIAVAVPHDGYIAAVDARALGLLVARLGGGRTRAGAAIDPLVGLAEVVKIGQPVSRGDTLAVVHALTEIEAAAALDAVRAAVRISATPISSPPLILEVLS